MVVGSVSGGGVVVFLTTRGLKMRAGKGVVVPRLCVLGTVVTSSTSRGTGEGRGGVAVVASGVGVYSEVVGMSGVCVVCGSGSVCLVVAILSL